MHSWSRRILATFAMVAFIACLFPLGSRSLALADSTLATPIAFVEAPVVTQSPTPVPAESPASMPSPSELALVTPTPEPEGASPIASTSAPSRTATPDQETPTATAVPPVDPIRVSAVTDDHATKPGATTSYRFRIANASSGPATVNLVASNSAPGWSAKIFDASGRAPILGPIVAPAQGFVEVIVRVTSPRAARAGEQNSTTLTASLIS